MRFYSLTTNYRVTPHPHPFFVVLINKKKSELLTVNKKPTNIIKNFFVFRLIRTFICFITFSCDDLNILMIQYKNVS